MKGRAILIYPPKDMVKEVAMLLKVLHSFEDVNVIFPSKRPLLFLSKELSLIEGHSLMSPKLFSMDEFVDFIYQTHVEKPLPGISTLDAVYYIDKINKENPVINTPDFGTLLPWAIKFFSDFEELYIEKVTWEKLSEIDELLKEEALTVEIKDKLLRFSYLYREFYNVVSNHFSTRALRYREVSGLPREIYSGKYILCGFYALTASEKEIFQNILSHSESIFIAFYDKKLENMLKEWEIPLKVEIPNEHKVKYHLVKATSPHAEITRLVDKLNKTDIKSQGTVVVLPNEQLLFAVYNNIGASDVNISMGYPVLRTPVFSLLGFIEELLTNAKGERFFKKDYLNMILHPYIKNTKIRNRAQTTRILMHSIENRLTNNPKIYIELHDIERHEVVEEALDIIKPESVKSDELFSLLQNIHDIFIRSFFDVKNIGDFIDKIVNIIDFVSKRTTANLHPFGSPFIEETLKALLEMRHSLVTHKSLDSISSYFNLVRSYMKTKKIPFKGTPLKGLQILGSLETRNLRFKNVFYLDLNEGTVPDVKKYDTVLTEALRRHLGLSTSKDREKITRYYFFNLIKGAYEAYLFYQEKDREKSRYIEMIKWEEEKKHKTLDVISEEIPLFSVSFAHKRIEAVKKTEKILQKLHGIEFSPTMLNTYLQCPLKFYYKYILGLREKDETRKYVVAKDMGSMAHRILHRYFARWKGKMVNIKDLSNEQEILDEIINKEFGNVESNEVYLQREQLRYILFKLLKKHTEHLKGVRILALEQIQSAYLTNTQKQKIKIKGVIDRVHKKDGTTYIIDYKTGNAELPQKTFVPDKENREQWLESIKSVQMPFYIFLYKAISKEEDIKSIKAQLWSLKDINNTKGFEKTFTLEDPLKAQAYKNMLITLINEIIDISRPFEPIKEEDANKACVFCPFNVLCDRKWVKKSYS